MCRVRSSNFCHLFVVRVHICYRKSFLLQSVISSSFKILYDVTTFSTRTKITKCCKAYAFHNSKTGHPFIKQPPIWGKKVAILSTPLAGSSYNCWLDVWAIRSAVNKGRSCYHLPGHAADAASGDHASHSSRWNVVPSAHDGGYRFSYLSVGAVCWHITGATSGREVVYLASRK